MASLGKTNKPVKRKRVLLTLKQKVEICQRLEKGENRNILMKEFNIGSSTLYDIKAQSGALKDFIMKSESEKSVEKRYTLHTAKLGNLDSALYEWFTLKRSEGTAISGPILIAKAKEFYEKMNIQEPCAFSDGWLSRFKLRHGIRKLDISGEQKSADVKSAEEFCEYFQKFITENNLTADQIYNADETGLLWRCLPTTTLAGGNETIAHGFKRNKDRVTVLVTGNAAGTHRCKLTVIGKFAKPRCFKNITYLPVHYKSQSNAWMNSEIFLWWFNQVFVPEVKENLKKKGLPETSKVVLLLDNCRAHPPAHELTNGNIFVCYLPPNVTSLIQPMDQGVIQNFKMFYRRDFMRKLANYDGKIQEFQSKFTLKDAIFTLSCAWDSVKNETLRRCWRKLWPLVMFENESDDEDENFEGFNVKTRKTTKDTYQDIIELLDSTNDENPMKTISRDELDEWLEIDKEAPVVMTMSTEEIIEAVQNPVHLTEEKESDEEEEEAIRVTWKNAASAFDTLISFAEQETCFTAHDVIRLHVMQSTFLQARRKACKQSDIRDLFNRQFTLPSSQPSTSAAADIISIDPEESTQ